MKKNQIHEMTLKLTIMAILTALVIVLQLFGSVFKIGTVNLSFVLIPIVLGGIFVGKSGGAFLGLIFGMITLIAGITGADYFTHILFTNSPAITTLICIGKGTLAGLGSAWIYQLVSKKNPYLATYAASAVAPIINTGLFIFGALFLKDVISTNFVAEGTTFLYFLLIGCAGINFIVELIINLVFAPGVFAISKEFTKKKKKK